MQILSFDVHDMTCGSVQRALSMLEGVSHVDVTLRPGTAAVKADPTRVMAAPRAQRCDPELRRSSR